jgi:hypothetical protein
VNTILRRLPNGQEADEHREGCEEEGFHSQSQDGGTD